MNMESIIDALLNGAEKEAVEKNKLQIDQFLKDHPADHISPESFNTFFDGEQDLVKTHLISIYFPESKKNHQLQTAIARWDYIYRFVGKLVEKKHGTIICSMDCARWITDKYLIYIREGTLPDMNIDEHCYYKPDFGSAQQWMAFCDSLIHLYYGNPTKFIKIYSELDEEPIKHK